MEIVQAVEKLNSISRAQLNFWRRPILCTTLYRNLMQGGNFGGTFDQLFLWIFLWNFQRRCLSTSSIPWCKKVKNDQKLKSRGSCLKSKTKRKHKTVLGAFKKTWFSKYAESIQSKNRALSVTPYRLCRFDLIEHKRANFFVGSVFKLSQKDVVQTS